METHYIGIKEFRQRITTLWKEAQEKNIRFVVLHRSKPILEVLPFTDTQTSQQEPQPTTRSGHINCIQCTKQ